MAAARLSPAASLLRNSRLFAIPSPLSLPAVEPSSEPTVQSDTATTPYPIRAALETPLASLNRGDWGLKRALPTKTTTKSGTPTIRIQRGIDTPEHVADFESAADHVLTLRKYQELNLRITLPAVPKDRRPPVSVFEREADNTAETLSPHLGQQAALSWLDLSPAERAQHMPEHLKQHVQNTGKAEDGEPLPNTQSPAQSSSSSPMDGFSDGHNGRRWRYAGPYLAGLNGMEFDTFLKNITREKKAAFKALVKNHLAEQRASEARTMAMEQGREEEVAGGDVATITEQDVADHLRYLRSEPGKFGPLIAQFFDLADGPNPSSGIADPWSYGRQTISAELYKESGPPRTHPSAGLSYAKLDVLATNDPVTGPKGSRRPVAARLLRSRPGGNGQNIPIVGVAGFVIRQPTSALLSDSKVKWQAVKDGPKMVVAPHTATVSQTGKLEMQATLQLDMKVENDAPVDPQDKSVNKDAAAVTRRSSPRVEAPGGGNKSFPQLPSLDRLLPSRQPRPGVQPSRSLEPELEFAKRASSQIRQQRRS